MDYAGLITKILLATGQNQTELASHLRVTQPTISRAIHGSKPKVDTQEALVAYAREIGILDQQNSWSTVPITGYIGKDGELYSSVIEQNHNKSSEMPPKPDADIVAVVCRGNDMLPSIEDGWIVYIDNGLAPLADLVGKICIVTLESGQRFAKRIFPGSSPDTWNLHAPNGATMRDQRVIEAHRIRWIKPS